MNVVLVTHYFPAHGGGIERVADNLARRMVEEGGMSIVWCASDTDSPPEGPGIRWAPMRASNIVERLSGFPYPLWTVPSLLRLARLVREADAVHVHDAIYMGSMAAATLAKWYGKRLVVTQHIGEVPLPAPVRCVLALANRIASRLVLARADAVAFISPVVQAYFESILGRRQSFHYVPNGVDLEVFHPTSEPVHELRARLGFDPGRPLLLFVGRFVPKKRLYIVRAMAASRPDWQWCVIGQGPEQPTRWGLSNVSVRGPIQQAQLADFYRAADLLVLPSEGEGFPLVVQEAMACGLPACITNEVAAGSTVPSELFLALPSDSCEAVDLGLTLLRSWLLQLGEVRQAARDQCAHFAVHNWSWDAAARIHTNWLVKGRNCD